MAKIAGSIGRTGSEKTDKMGQTNGQRYGQNRNIRVLGASHGKPTPEKNGA
jgi:hypothetical protein